MLDGYVDWFIIALEVCLLSECLAEFYIYNFFFTV